MVAVFLPKILADLKNGSHVRFVWRECREELISPDGNAAPIDGRAYQGFLKRHQHKMRRQEVGDTEAGDLVITWHAK